jgi:anti-sigma B factor antagonist
MSLALTSRLCGNVFVIHCEGRIVAGDEAKSLEKALDMASREVPCIVLQVSNVERLDSTGIGLLVRFATRLRKLGGELRLASPPQFITDLLSLTMLSSVLPVDPTEDDALLSFLKQPMPQRKQGEIAGRVLVLDQSPDLCAFVRSVLTQHDFEVRSASLVRDARMLLQVDPVDYILLGSDSPQLCSEPVLGALKALAPNATTLQLAPGFKNHDAFDATSALLQLLGVQKQSSH